VSLVSPCRAVVVSLLLLSCVRADPVPTELHYNPSSPEPAWEWIEIHNAGADPLDLAGFVLDDGAGSDLGAANVAGAVVPPGEVAVLYNASLAEASFASAWGAGLRLVAVSSWPSLNNGGDTIGLWPSLGAYAGDRPSNANALFSLTYDDSDPWPADDGAASIALKDAALAFGDGASWVLSVAGVSGGLLSTMGDVGSPGFVEGRESPLESGGPGATSGAGAGEPVPEPGTLALLGGAYAVAAVVARRRRRKGGAA